MNQRKWFLIQYYKWLVTYTIYEVTQKNELTNSKVVLNEILTTINKYTKIYDVHSYYEQYIFINKYEQTLYLAKMIIFNSYFSLQLRGLCGFFSFTNFLRLSGYTTMCADHGRQGENDYCHPIFFVLDGSSSTHRNLCSP